MPEIYEYDIFFPTENNDGTPYPDTTIAQFKARLIEHFGGLTDFRHKSAGTWKVGGVAFRDEILLLRVLSTDEARGRAFLKNFRQEMERSLHQKEVLIIERRVRRV